MSNRPLWQILIAIWFIPWGLLQVTSFTFALAPVILGILAIAAGILYFLNK